MEARQNETANEDLSEAEHGRVNHAKAGEETPCPEITAKSTSDAFLSMLQRERDPPRHTGVYVGGGGGGGESDDDGEAQQRPHKRARISKKDKRKQRGTASQSKKETPAAAAAPEHVTAQATADIVTANKQLKDLPLDHDDAEKARSQFIRDHVESAAPGGLKLKAIQREAILKVIRLITQQNVACLGLSMGLGKTISAAVIARLLIEHDNRADNVMMLAPGVLIQQWLQDVARVYPEAQDVARVYPEADLKAHIINSTTIKDENAMMALIADRSRGRWFMVDTATLLNEKHARTLCRMAKFLNPMFIVDEVQASYRKRDSVFSAALSAIINASPSEDTLKLMVSGTPITNLEVEAQKLLETFTPKQGAPFNANPRDCQRLLESMTFRDDGTRPADLPPGAIYNVILPSSAQCAARRLLAPKRWSRAITLGDGLNMERYEKYVIALRMAHHWVTKRGESVIIAVDSREGVKHLGSELNAMGLRNHVAELFGELDKKEQAHNLQLVQLKDSKPWVLICTTQFIAQGYNLTRFSLTISIRPDYVSHITKQLWNRTDRPGQENPATLMLVITSSDDDVHIQQLAKKKIGNTSDFYQEGSTFSVPNIEGLGTLETVEDALHFLKGVRCLTEHGVAVEYGRGFVLHSLSPTKPKPDAPRVADEAINAIRGLKALPWEAAAVGAGGTN
jgi:superfamily II DNA or RNA helicase